METPTFAPPTAVEIEKYLQWWNGLSDQWKQAFNEVMLNQSSLDDLPLVTMHMLWNSPALRFAGPQAPYPNMSFELDNLDGVLEFTKVHIFVFSYHHVQEIRDIQRLTQLTSLFVFDNKLQHLEGVEKLVNLEELFFQGNQVSSLAPLENLTQLHTINCSHNLISSLEPLGTQHDKLKQLFCTPNPNLSYEEIRRLENELKIRCKGPM